MVRAGGINACLEGSYHVVGIKHRAIVELHAFLQIAGPDGQVVIGDTFLGQGGFSRAIGVVAVERFQHLLALVTQNQANLVRHLSAYIDTLEQIREIPRVIGVAGGADKVDVIRAALRGGLLDVLVTDEESAEKLLE